MVIKKKENAFLRYYKKGILEDGINRYPYWTSNGKMIVGKNKDIQHNCFVKRCKVNYLLSILFTDVYSDGSVDIGDGYQSRGREFEPRLGYSFFSTIDAAHCD